MFFPKLQKAAFPRIVYIPEKIVGIKLFKIQAVQSSDTFFLIQRFSCKMLELEDREQRGIEKGVEKGIEAMIRAFRNLNITEGEICRQLQKECHLSEEAARQYMSRG